MCGFIRRVAIQPAGARRACASDIARACTCCARAADIRAAAARTCDARAADVRAAADNARLRCRRRTHVDTLIAIGKRRIGVTPGTERIPFIERRVLIHLAVRSERALRQDAVDTRCDGEFRCLQIKLVVGVITAARAGGRPVISEVPAVDVRLSGRAVVRARRRPVEDLPIEIAKFRFDFRRQGAVPIHRRRAVFDAARVVHIAPALIRRLRIRNDIQRAAADDALVIINCIVAILRRDLIVRQDGSVLLEGIAHLVMLVFL